MQHPDAHHLQLFVAGQLDVEKEKTVEEHLARCPECKKIVTRLEREPRDPLLQRIKAVAASNDDSLATVVHADHPKPGEGPVSSLLMPGDVLSGTLQLEAILGRGGMGEAWKAVDPLARRHVVLKFVPGEMQHLKEAMDSVRSSFQKIHALQHQNICPVYSLVDDPKYGIYIVMKYIDGLTLSEYRRHRAELNSELSFDDIVRILRGVAKGLDYAHERKVIHRDIKPGNIMISRKDGIQVIDFGLAEEIRTSMAKVSEVVMEVSGTRPYMAPEQWLGRTQDARTDQYALAVTAYELLAGHLPFSGSDMTLLKNSVLDDAPEPIPGLPDPVNAALLKGLSKKREDRFSDCMSFVTALEKGAAAFRSAEKASERLKIAGMAGLGAAVVCTLLFVLFGFFFGKSTTAKPEPEIALPVFSKEPEKPVAAQTPRDSGLDEKELATAPRAFREQMKKIAGEIESDGGFAVAGQVVEKNGSPLPKGTYTVALKYNDSNARDTHRFDDGWFITQRESNSMFDKLVAATFQHDEVEIPLKINEGEINFHRVFLERTSKTKSTTLEGTVLNEKSRPIAEAHVGLTLSRSNGYFESPLSIDTVTDSEGRYSFSALPPQRYEVRVSLKQDSNRYAVFGILPGNDRTKLALGKSSDGLSRQEETGIVSTIFSPRRVVIDTLYQPDGSTDFDKNNVVKDRYTLELFGGGDIAMGDRKIGGRIIFDPKAERSPWGYHADDLRLDLRDGKCSFAHFYHNNRVGHYDLGEVDFDSVKEAEPEKIPRYASHSPCESNHVYVIRTYEKGHYAKFVVRSIEILEP